MKKLLIFLFIFILAININPVFAVTEQQITQQYQQINNLKSEISRLDTQSNNAETQLNQLNQQIEQNSQKLLAAQQEELELKQVSEERVKAAYMYGSQGYLNYLFSAEDPTDFISYFDVARDIFTADMSQQDELKAKREQIEQLQQKLESDRNSVIAAKKQSEATALQKQQLLSSNQVLVQQLENELTNQKALEQQANSNSTTPVVTVSPQMTQSISVASSNPSINQSNGVLSGMSNSTQSTAVASGIDSQQENSIEGEPTAAQTLPRFIEAITGPTDDFGMVAKSSNGQMLTQVANSSGSATLVSTNSLNGTWVWPLDANGQNAFTITSLMGTRESPGGIGSTDHGGTDIGANYGTAILAANSGKVVLAGEYGGYGNAVMIDHGNGLKTLYGHMSSVAVQNGTTVKAGQIIGFVGSTGWSTGPHLHFEVRYTDSNGTETKINGLSLYGDDIYQRLSYADY